jgi:hypothetical protein
MVTQSITLGEIPSIEQAALGDVLIVYGDGDRRLSERRSRSSMFLFRKVRNGSSIGHLGQLRRVVPCSGYGVAQKR